MAAQVVTRWWEGNYFPDAGEVVGWRCSDAPRSWPDIERRRQIVLNGEPPAGGVSGDRRPIETNRDRAVRRARTRVRRYAASNLLNRLIVLTWADQTMDLAIAKRHVRNFVRHGLRVTLRYRGAYVIGWERHKSGAWHANVLVGSWIDQERLERAWGRGWVWITRFTAGGQGGREAARRAASYVAKYVAKDLDGAAEPGGHRYEVGQGFQVRVVRVYALSASGVVEACGPWEVVHRFDAAAPEAGRGPPIVWAAFGAIQAGG